MNYKKLKIEYNTNIFKKPFIDNKEFNNREYFQELTIDLTTYNLPLYNIFRDKPGKNELTIFKLVKDVPLHRNPNNTGLIIFPIVGLHKYFYPDTNEEAVIDLPTIVNGTQLHEYKKLDNEVIGYIVKIPSELTWEQALNRVSDYIVD